MTSMVMLPLSRVLADLMAADLAVLISVVIWEISLVIFSEVCSVEEAVAEQDRLIVRHRDHIFVQEST